MTLTSVLTNKIGGFLNTDQLGIRMQASSQLKHPSPTDFGCTKKDFLSGIQKILVM